MKQRKEQIERLETELRSRGATLGFSDDFDDDMRESFLRHVLALEEEPTTTIREQLAARGQEVPGDLWSLIAGLAELNIVIAHTDHLDDQTLFERLLGYLDEGGLGADDPNTVTYVDIIGSGSEEDTTLFLRYYATDEDRELWKRELPDEDIPPREGLPFDRDRLLPTGEDVRRLVPS